MHMPYDAFTCHAFHLGLSQSCNQPKSHNQTMHGAYNMALGEGGIYFIIYGLLGHEIISFLVLTGCLVLPFGEWLAA